MRRTAWKRQPGKPMKRTALKQVSDGRRAERAIYLRRRKVFLAARPLCEAYRIIWPPGRVVPAATEVHHKFGRLGSNFLDESTWIAVASVSHQFIHNNARKARTLGLLA